MKSLESGVFARSFSWDRMIQTSVSLLERLRHSEDRAAWDRFVALYTPLIFSWARRQGLQDEDAADLVQDVFVILLQKMPDFHYTPGQSFRAWLYTVTVNKCHDQRRRRAAALRQGEAAPLESLAVPDTTEAVLEEEYRRYLATRALELMQVEFEPASWKACWEVVVNERRPAEVAAELGMTVAAVYAAKSRVLRRLREELDGMLF
jgi:RNA polymerase sigma-70 factor (ECF subfamily)